jgi:hypothetical protein
VPFTYGLWKDFVAYDYFWVRREGPPLDEVDSMVYDGEHLYPWFAVDHMLEHGIIQKTDIRYALKASRHFTDFGTGVDAIRAAWETIGDGDKWTKRMVNSCIGLWNQRDKARWTVRETVAFDDISRVDVVVSEGDTLPKCAARTQVVGPETCYPIGLIALHWECCTVHAAIRELQNHGATIHGVNVDGIFYSGAEGKVSTFIDTTYHPDDAPIYARKPGKKELCPRGPQRRDDHDRDLLQVPAWRHIRDDRDFEQLADEIVAHGSALVVGPAGTGKTRLNRLVNQKLEELGRKVVNTAITHAASRLMPGGRTLAHLLNVNRYGRVRDTTFCVDEIGMVPLSTLVRVGAWQLVGARFVLYGDFRGQFLPICDQWKGADIESSGIVQQLAGSLHVHLSTNRRAAGDDAHFRFYTGLYDSVGGPVPLEQARARYPLDREFCHVTLVVSHRKRRELNQFYNECRDRRGGVFVKCAGGVRHHNAPQHMWLRAGMRLLCCAKSHPTLVNGVFYTVVGVDKREVVVRMDEDYRRDATTLSGRAAEKARRQEGEIALSHRDASLGLRLSHALCYASVQGLTISEQHVLMLDVEHPHFDVRSLIVGLSRVRSARQIHVATAEQERALMARTRAVDPPPKEVEAEAGSESERGSDDESMDG